MEELDLKQILGMFLENKVIIIVTTILCMILGGVYSFFIMTPKYKAYTTIVLTKTQDAASKNDELTNAITQTDVMLNQNLVSTYSEIIKSSAILRQVIQNLPELSLVEKDLRKAITVEAVKDTEVIKISVVDENPEYATKIANEIGAVFSVKIKEIYKINNVYILDKAEVPDAPYNIKHIKMVVIAALVGIVLSCGYIILLNIFDTTIKTSEDIDKAVGLPTLVTLYKYDEKEEKRQKGKRKSSQNKKTGGRK